MVDGQLQLITDPQVTITVTNQRTGVSASLTHLNKSRLVSGGLYLYNEDFSTVSTHTVNSSGRMIRMELSGDSRGEDLTVNSSLELTVTEVFESVDDVTIGQDNYLLTASFVSGFAELFAGYQPGDTVTITTSYALSQSCPRPSGPGAAGTFWCPAAPSPTAPAGAMLPAGPPAPPWG